MNNLNNNIFKKTNFDDIKKVRKKFLEEYFKKFGEEGIKNPKIEEFLEIIKYSQKK